MKFNIPKEKIIPHVIFIIVALVFSFAVFYPVLEGKVLFQNDVTQAKGMQKEILDYHEKTGGYTLWTNSAFSGMPSYMIHLTGVPNNNIFHRITRIIRLGLPRYTVDVMFLYMIGFYILLLVLGVNPWLSIVGALAFAFSSYNLIYLEAGHVNKALAISMFPPAFAAVILVFKRKYLIGGVLFCLFLGVQIAYVHLQITYYLFLVILGYGIYQLIELTKSKNLKHFSISVAMLVLAAAFAVLPNITSIVTTYEYGKVSMRGGSELAAYEKDTEEQKGLDPDYAMAWSNGTWETLTLLYPNFRGGSTIGELSEKSHLYDALVQNNVPRQQIRQYTQQVYTYWGSKSSTSGPFYFGAIIIFLFVFGMFIVRSNIKWWLLILSIIAIMLSWGENFSGFYQLFFKYFPLFNKFRVPETFLVIVSILVPILAMLSIKELFDGKLSKNEYLKGLKNTLYILGGLSIFFLLFAGGMFDFVSQLDVRMQNFPEWFVSAIREDREALLKKDVGRSLLFIIIAAALIYFYLNQKLRKTYFIGLIGLFIVIDLWAIDSRYLKEESYIKKKQATEIQPTRADLQILQDPDPNYRVFNLTISPFQEAQTSYFHKSLGGYHGAKISRYQDIIEHHLAQQNMKVINMLNTKYFIVPGQDNQPVAQLNPGALGNAWYINKIRFVDNPKEEIDALNDIEPANEVVVNKKYEGYFTTTNFGDSIQNTSSIVLEEYEPNKLVYKSKSDDDGFVVFSEIYYNDNKGWKAYIDGAHTKHIQVDYILRGLNIPKGEHIIEFKFEPQNFYKAQKVALTSSIIVAIVLLLSIGGSVWKNLKPSVTDNKE